MKIGILTICTGKYTMFFDDLYQSLEKYFLTNHDKKYYVFTDGDIISESNIIKIHQRKLGWPYDTMMRFHMFKSIKNLLLENDYVFFFNANMKALKPIGDEVIPQKENDYLMGVLHPGFAYKDRNQFTYDRNRNCTCFIPYNEGNHYFQGCFNGGKSEVFLEMCDVLSTNIDIDLKNNIIPLWHDESQLNWYFKDRNPLVIGYSYAHPENWSKQVGPETKQEHSDLIDKIIIQIDKDKFNKDFLRS